MLAETTKAVPWTTSESRSTEMPSKMLCVSGHPSQRERTRRWRSTARIRAWFHYLLEARELGGKSEDGGFGGPLCKDPFGPEVPALVERLWKEADQDRTLCYDSFHDPCPRLTPEPVATCKTLTMATRP